MRESSIEHPVHAGPCDANNAWITDSKFQHHHQNPTPTRQQGLKKGDKGLCLIAGDIYPIDVISHLPVLCEEKDTAYIYVPSKHDLGAFSCVCVCWCLMEGSTDV